MREIIYIATNLVNRKQYIGQTINGLKKRKNGHYYSIKRDNLPFHNALKKYNKENFKWISFECPIEDLDYNERLLIKDLNTLSPNGYNLDNGGHQNKKRSEITKKKISQSKIGKYKGKNNPNYGNHKLVGENNPNWGKPRSEEIKQKIRDNQPNQSGEKNPFYGKHHSSKSKEKNRLSHLGKNIGENHPQARAVILISPEGKECQPPARLKTWWLE